MMRTCEVCGSSKPQTEEYYKIHNHGKQGVTWKKVCLDCTGTERKTEVRSQVSASKTKVCQRCQQPKALDAFGKHSNGGIYPVCRSCWTQQQKTGTLLLRKQDFKCGICGATKQKLLWDHDHSCCPKNKVCGHCNRSFLCSGCNTRIGRVENMSAIASPEDRVYLRLWKIFHLLA